MDALNSTKVTLKEFPPPEPFQQCDICRLPAKQTMWDSDNRRVCFFCDQHAPKNAVNIERPEELELWTENPATREYSSGNAKLRSLLTPQFGIRLQSTGDAANIEQSHIIMQTLDASPENPYLLTFDQFILDPFTGAGQFDLVERDSRRRVFDGESAGGTAVLTSATMNFQPEDVGQIIRVGRNPGRIYSILSVENEQNITLSGNITLPSIELTLTMDGENEVTLATKSGFAEGVTTGGWSRLVKVITADKTYKVVFVPGDTGDGLYSIKVGRVN